MTTATTTGKIRTTITGPITIDPQQHTTGGTDPRVPPTQDGPRKMIPFRPLALACLLLAPLSAKADVVDTVIRQLRADGYSTVTVSRTLLGRARIVGEGGRGAREIVLDRRTGEVLRDWRDDRDDDDRHGGDDDRDDDNDDDRDDDHGGNSGSGGGGDDDDDD